MAVTLIQLIAKHDDRPDDVLNVTGYQPQMLVLADWIREGGPVMDTLMPLVNAEVARREEGKESQPQLRPQPQPRPPLQPLRKHQPFKYDPDDFASSLMDDLKLSVDYRSSPGMRVVMDRLKALAAAYGLDHLVHIYANPIITEDCAIVGLFSGMRVLLSPVDNSTHALKEIGSWYGRLAHAGHKHPGNYIGLVLVLYGLLRLWWASRELDRGGSG